MLDGEALFIGITIGSMDDAFKQAVVGPSPEDRDKVMHFSLPHFWLVMMCKHCVALSLFLSEFLHFNRLWNLESSGGIKLH